MININKNKKDSVEGGLISGWAYIRMYFFVSMSCRWAYNGGGGGVISGWACKWQVTVYVFLFRCLCFHYSSGRISFGNGKLNAHTSQVEAIKNALLEQLCDISNLKRDRTIYK